MTVDDTNGYTRGGDDFHLIPRGARVPLLGQPEVPILSGRSDDVFRRMILGPPETDPVSASMIPLGPADSAKLKRLADHVGKSPIGFLVDWLRAQPEPPP